MLSRAGPITFQALYLELVDKLLCKQRLDCLLNLALARRTGDLACSLMLSLDPVRDADATEIVGTRLAEVGLVQHLQADTAVKVL